MKDYKPVLVLVVFLAALFLMGKTASQGEGVEINIKDSYKPGEHITFTLSNNNDFPISLTTDNSQYTCLMFRLEDQRGREVVFDTDGYVNHCYKKNIISPKETVNLGSWDQLVHCEKDSCTPKFAQKGMYTASVTYHATPLGDAKPDKIYAISKEFMIN